MHTKNIQTAGKPLKEADKVLILLHGRGASSGDILSLVPHLQVQDFALLAPQATNHTWYPYSFMAKTEENEPWLSSALDLVDGIVGEITGEGIEKERIHFLGFSQGACLTLEYTCRHATRYGGVVALTGGLIGDRIVRNNYPGDLNGTPVFIGTGNPDPHVPLERVHETVQVLKEMNARVALEVYDGRPHTVSQDEIDRANELIFNA